MNPLKLTFSSLLTLILVLILMGCGDMFSTTSVTPRPDSINEYGPLFSSKEAITYSMKEWVHYSDSKADPESILENHQMVNFSYIGEVELDNVIWSNFKLSVSDAESEELVFSRNFNARLDEEGSKYLLDSTDSGPRFFLLKTTTTGLKRF